MSELEQFLDTSSPRFECVDDPPQSPCPMEDKSKEPIINSATGERICPQKEIFWRMDNLPSSRHHDK